MMSSDAMSEVEPPSQYSMSESDGSGPGSGIESDGVSESGDVAPSINRVTIDQHAVTTNSLKALQGEDQRKVMDIVDKLRRAGLNGIVELPQLVVCGDQSSGKSSVLEAITEIPFPRKENLCTRFATEIILRRSTSSTISITITPDKTRPKKERNKLVAFNKSIEDFNQLPAIIEEATDAMGLGAVGSANSRAFCRDVLSVQIEGPDRPQLSLVDLPGLIHSANKAQTEADKSLILGLVREYMENERTIILAVVSAKNDYANQIILDHARKIDPNGRRTLGIITKPDYLRKGTENELSWIELAQNKDIYLERGWHMLKNRGEDQMGFSFAQRNEDEDKFFSEGRYANLPRECVGINSLRQRLSKVLLDHLIKELPSLKLEMEAKLEEVEKAIEKMGEKRSTTSEQRMMLMKISMAVTDILKSATKGYYENNFFGSVAMNAAPDSKENIRRFRAVIQHLNIKFSETMRVRGHKYAVGVGPGDDEQDQAEEVNSRKELNKIRADPNFKHIHKPKLLSREQAIDWVKATLERSRGYELPGTFQPMLISQLFWEQSQPWAKIAFDHITNVARVCKEFVYIVLQHTAPAELLPRITGVSVDDALKQSLAAAKEELGKLLTDKSRHPMTYNHYFTTTIQKQRQRKHSRIAREAFTDAMKASESSICVQSVGYQTFIRPSTLTDKLDFTIEQDMDVFSSEDALDNQRAYYKDELKYFVNACCKTVVERHLVEPLSDIILSPLVVAQMTDKEVQFVAAEPPEVTQQRSFLETRKAMLEKGLDTFHEAMGGLRR